MSDGGEKEDGPPWPDAAPLDLDPDEPDNLVTIARAVFGDMLEGSAWSPPS